MAMPPLTSIVINWTGKKPTPEQMLVMQDAALEFESKDGDERIMFEHPLCDGLIECKGRMQHGVYRGTRFVATLDGEASKPRTFEFLLTDYHEKSDLRAAECFTLFEPKRKKATLIDAAVTRKTRTTAVKRSRAN